MIWNDNDDMGSVPAIVEMGKLSVDDRKVDEPAEDDEESTEGNDPVFLKPTVGTGSGVVMLSRKNLTLTKNTNECTSCPASIAVGLKTYRQQAIRRSSGFG